MSEKVSRRSLVKSSFAGALASTVTFEHQPLLAKMKGYNAPTPDSAGGAPPMGRLGKLNVTRLICGGNLFSGFGHSGDLVYVSRLLKHYFDEKKILDTLQICEESGINTTILRTDAHIIGVLKRYRKERGGKLQWIAQTYPEVGKLKENVQLAIDNGAVGAFVMGANAEKIHKEGRTELLGEVVGFMKQNGLVAGVGSHQLAVPKAIDAMKIEPDFYFKTLNNVGYAADDPADVASYMKAKTKPWVAFKVLGAGRMQPRDGFDLAFRSGADFINVGMYDFQVKEDVAFAKESIAKNATRGRAWSA